MKLCVFITTKEKNMSVANTKPIFQANLFWGAPTYSGTCLPTIKRPSIREGENIGFTKTRMIISVKNTVTKYLSTKKSPSKCTCMIEANRTKNSNPAEALISRSFKTGVLYPATVSPKFIVLLIFFSMN